MKGNPNIKKVTVHDIHSCMCEKNSVFEPVKLEKLSFSLVS